MNEIICYGIYGNSTRQEYYETRSRDAGRRARQLRKLGYRVTTGSIGPQVTKVGIVNLTSVNIYNPDDNLPEPDKLERI
jgi:hypothetical protein